MISFSLFIFSLSLSILSLIYGSQIWGQIKTQLFQELVKLQNRAIGIISLLPFNSSKFNKTYSDLKTLKLSDFISLQDSLFLKDSFENEISSQFINYFQKSMPHYSHRTCSAFKTVLLSQKLTQAFAGKISIKYQYMELISQAIQETMLFSPFLSFPLLFSSSFSCLIPYSFSALF